MRARVNHFFRLAWMAATFAACAGGGSDDGSPGQVGSRIETIVSDNFATGTHQSRYFLRSPSGIRTPVTESDLSFIRTLDGTSGSGLLQTPEKKTSLRIGALLVNFQNDPSQPWSRAQIEGELFSNSLSLASYYREASFGRVKITGDVLGWYTLPFNRPTGCQDMTDLLSRTIEALPQINFDHYTNIIIGIPRICDDWDGFGTVGGIVLPGANQMKSDTMPVAWVNGGVSFGPVSIHELGHNLGIHHANGCEDAPSQFGCTSKEYEDPFDIMGYVHLFEKPRQMNVYHKEVLGWFGEKNVTVATHSGEYTLAPLEIRTDVPQVIKIPRNGNSWYYLEYRQPIGFDSEIPVDSAAAEGVSIRLAPMFLSGGDSHLIDTTPLGISRDRFDDAALREGQTYYDSVAKIQITTTQRTSQALTVSITMTPSDPITAPLPPPPPNAGDILCSALDPSCQ